MKIRTESQLGEFIDADLAWRKKELTQLKFLLEGARSRNERDVLLRSAITLLYAHWEGFIKAAGLAYLEYVAAQKLQFDELAPNFLALAARSRLSTARDTNRIQAHLELTRFFRSGLNARSVLPYKDGITTRANLSSRVLNEITDTLGLNFSSFATKTHLMDEVLLKSRNTIAHGEHLLITEQRYEELAQEVLEMMENFRTQIQNAASLRAFKATYSGYQIGGIH